MSAALCRCHATLFASPRHAAADATYAMLYAMMLRQRHITLNTAPLHAIFAMLLIHVVFSLPLMRYAPPPYTYRRYFSCWRLLYAMPIYHATAPLPMPMILRYAATRDTLRCRACQLTLSLPPLR